VYENDYFIPYYGHFIDFNICAWFNKITCVYINLIMKWFLRYKLHHVLIWIIYFVFWTSFSMRFNKVSFTTSFLVTAAWFIGQAGICYFCIYALIPHFFYKKRYGIFIVYLAATIILSAVFTAAFTVRLLTQLTTNFTIPFRTFVLYVLLDNFTIAILVIAAKVIKDRVKSEQRNQLLEREKTENELRFLRSQLNPHFLFNAINSIYVLIRKDPDFAARTLAKFADMLRYQLYECNVDKIPFQKEIAYLNNYIELEKLRKGNTVIIHCNIDKGDKDFAIAPLVIIPFVENAFKYVSAFSDKPNVITLAIKYLNKLFTLCVENTTDENLMANQEGSFRGIGLENVKRRLELIYNDRYSLEITKQSNTYSVLLNIQIQ
jgi:two-component system LytT family sensor kinase